MTAFAILGANCCIVFLLSLIERQLSRIASALENRP